MTEITAREILKLLDWGKEINKIKELVDFKEGVKSNETPIGILFDYEKKLAVYLNSLEFGSEDYNLKYSLVNTILTKLIRNRINLAKKYQLFFRSGWAIVIRD